MPAVVIGSSEGAADNGPDGARQIRRRLRQVFGNATLVRGAAWALAVVAAAVAIGAALVHGQVTDVGSIEQVTLRSGSYADFRQVFAREAPAVMTADPG